LSITSRVPNGTILGSTDTVSRELGLPEAVIPLPVWQLTSKRPSSTPRAVAVVVGVREWAGVVVPGRETGDGVASVQAAKRTTPATAPSSGTVGAGKRRSCRAQIGMSSSRCSG